MLYLIHLDVSGLMSVASLQGSSYYVTFINDISKKTWILFMKTKDEVFSWFQEFRAQVDNQTGKMMKVLRSSNGGEYTSNDFKDSWKEAWIKRELIVSYNPHRNGIVERNNRSIIESVRDMIHDQEFPMFMWVEEFNTSVYVKSKSPHRILRDTTL
jgi:hypothetical protein